MDDAKRPALVQQAEATMEQDPPLLPAASEKVNDHNPYHYFGIYDVVRWDTVWLDK